MVFTVSISDLKLWPVEKNLLGAGFTLWSCKLGENLGKSDFCKIRMSDIYEHVKRNTSEQEQVRRSIEWILMYSIVSLTL